MNELYHSNTYLGSDYSDGIKHWKYKKKYKGRNGKWIYVYNKIKKRIATNKKVEREEEGWAGPYGVSPVTLNNKYTKFNNGKTGGTYSFDANDNNALKRTNRAEIGKVTYNVKNGKQLFDSYDETTKTTIKNGTAYVERKANVTYGYIHRATNFVESGKKKVEKFSQNFPGSPFIIHNQDRRALIFFHHVFLNPFHCRYPASSPPETAELSPCVLF